MITMVNERIQENRKKVCFTVSSNRFKKKVRMNEVVSAVDGATGPG